MKFFLISLLLVALLTNATKKVCKCPSKEKSTFDRDTLQGEIDSPNYPDGYCKNMDCSWNINPADPWTAIRLKFIDFYTEAMKDFVEIWIIENGTLILMDKFSGPGTKPDLITSVGSGVKIVFKSVGSNGYGFRLRFHRFSAVSWTGIFEQDMKHDCESLTEVPSLFHVGSCFTLNPEGSFAPSPDADRTADTKGNIGSNFTLALDNCTHFPNGHLVLLNNADLAFHLHSNFEKNMTGQYSLWVGLFQAEKSFTQEVPEFCYKPDISAYYTPVECHAYEIPERGWQWQLPDGRNWPAEFESTMWNTVDVDGTEPDNQGGGADQDCASVSVTGLYDVWCPWKYQHMCEYESLYACPKMLHEISTQWDHLEVPMATKETRCYYVLRAQEHKSIHIKLNAINLGEYDRLEVFDGVSGTSHQNWMVTWMGDSIEAIQESGQPIELISRTNTFLIVFDCTENERSFNVSYKMVDSPCVCPNESYTEKQGTVTSPGYPGHYCNNLDCHWRFETGDSDTVVQFKVKSFELAEGDYMLLDNGQNEQSDETVLGKIESASDESIFTARSPAALFFHSDNEWKSSGFKIDYKFIKIDPLCQCPLPQPTVNEELSGSMVFKHTESNCDFIDCVFVLPTPNLTPSGLDELRIRLNGSVNAIKPHGHLTIYNGRPMDPDRSVIAREAGKRQFALVYQPHGDVSSWADGLTIHYHAQADDTQTSGHGFDISYQWLLNCSCGDPPAEVTDRVQLFSSPEFPNNYCPDLDCTWRLKALDGYRVVLEMLFMRIQTNYDYLDVLDGWSDDETNRQYFLKRFSGFLIETEPVRSHGSTVELYFHSDSQLQFSGFQFRYYMEQLPWPEPQLMEEDSDTELLELLLIIVCVLIVLQIIILVIYLIFGRRYLRNSDKKAENHKKARRKPDDKEKKHLNQNLNST